MFSFMALSSFTVVLVLLTAAGVSCIQSWKTQFYKYPKWTGHLEYLDQYHFCTMTVHSVQKDDNGGGMVSFYDIFNQIHIDMSAYSENDVVIVFKQESVYQPADHELYKNFQFAAEIMMFGGQPALIGNLTNPSYNYSYVQMIPVRNTTSRWRNHTGSSALSIGLAVGISVFLVIVCTVIGIVVLRWGIRSGYLRHVARSYKSFRNPDTPVSFDNTQPNQQESSVNVHI